MKICRKFDIRFKIYIYIVIGSIYIGKSGVNNCILKENGTEI